MTDDDEELTEVVYPSLRLDPWLGVFLVSKAAHGVAAVVTSCLEDVVDACGMHGNWRHDRRRFASEAGREIDDLIDHKEA